MTVVFVLYWLAVFGLFVYGLNCYWLAAVFHRHRRDALSHARRVRRRFAAATTDDDLPVVTVQLPVYNERWVVGRLIKAVERLDWPRDRLDVQVLDDSTDDTSEIVSRLVRHYRRRGLAIEHLRRAHRCGFKAGALRDGLIRARGDLVAVFDADFVPAPDFLRRTIPFFGDPGVGLVQCRWGHVNEDESLLTRTQAMAIDGHFGIEQAARAWGGFLLNFNGTAGVWRRQAIVDAGGWQADTLTEDLDLSYRAQLAGWRLEYLLDVEVPAEIPTELSAFKAQQRRWAKGSIQTALKLLPRVLRADLRPGAKLQAVLHLTHYFVHPLMLTVALLALPLLALWRGPWAPLPFAAMIAMLVVATAGPSTLYLSAQRALRRDWMRRSARLPALMLLGTGIALSNTRAVAEALAGVRSPFVRTPKHGGRGRSAARASRYAVPVGFVPLAEAALAAYCAWGLVLYLQAEKYLIGPYLALYALGFAAVACGTIRELLPARATDADGAAGRASNDAVAASEASYALALSAWRPAPRFGGPGGAPLTRGLER